MAPQESGAGAGRPEPVGPVRGTGWDPPSAGSAGPRSWPARLRARLLIARNQPATLLVWALTAWVGAERRRRWRERGRLGWLEPVLRRGWVRMPYGLASGMRLGISHLDLGGSAAFGQVRGISELEVQQALRRALPRGGVLYDVGANVGTMTLVGANLVGPAGQVVAVEPDPRNAEATLRHAALNQLHWVRVVRAAAREVSEPVEMVTVSDGLWTRFARFGSHRHAVGRITVEGIALDDLATRPGVRPPDVVKIDAEGAELDILDGMTRLLAEGRPVLIVEVHATNEQLVQRLHAAGYALSSLEGPERPEHGHDNLHVLAEPQESVRARLPDRG